MPHCRECDSHVSKAFARVFGHPKTGEVVACPSCTSWTDMNEVHR